MEETKPENPQFTPKGSPNDASFLDGPHSRWKELMFLLDVGWQFMRGLRKLHFVGPCATVFGSARFKEDHPFYQTARKLGAELALMGFTIMTGGGPGIMEAANRGAKDVNGKSVGCNIVLPVEQHPNPYLDKWVDIDYFFIRKTLLSKYSYAFVVMPGGYGTLDEFFEAIVLIQTGKFDKFPVVVVGTEYHEELYKHIENLVAAKAIAPGDINLFLCTDSIDEALKHIRKHAIEGFKLQRHKYMKPWWLLGESS